MIFNRIATLFTLLATAASAQQTNTKVNISIQPAFHGIPIFAAQQFGWFKELGLDVELSLYASGGPQVQDAVDNRAWDFGIAGSVPNVLAGAQGIRTVGINNDESATTEVFGAPGVTAWPPENLYDSIFAATADSTGELLLRKCLEAAGIGFNDDHVVESTQSDILTNLDKQTFLNGDTVDEEFPSYGSLWAPNTYAYESAHPRNANVMCSGRDVNFQILGGLMVRGDFADEYPDVVAKILAAYLRGVSFMQNKQVEKQVLEISYDFYLFAGNPPANEISLQEDLLLRPLFNLDQQLDAMNRNFANNYESELDKHYLELEDFLFDHNVIEQKFLPKEYVTDLYMKMVSDDEELRAFSYFGAIRSDQSNESGLEDETAETGLIVGIVLCTVGAVSLVVALVICLAKSKKHATAPVLEKEGPAGDSSISWRKETV